MSKSDERSGDGQGRDLAEWVSLGIASLLVLAVIGLVVTLWITETDSPAEFTLEAGEVREADSLYYLHVTLTNEGDQTAAQVQVEGTVGRGASQDSPATAADFVPAQSEADVTLVFTQHPSDVDLRVVSYQQP